MITNIVGVFGFSLLFIVSKIIYALVPFFTSIAGVFGDLSFKKIVFIICGIFLAVGIFLDIGLEKYKEMLVEKKINKVRKEYNPDLLPIKEDFYNKYRDAVNWVDNDTALLAEMCFSEGVEALMLKQFAKARTYFERSVKKCEKLNERPFDELKASALNNLIVVEYLDPLYKKLKEHKLKQMMKYAEDAVLCSPNNSLIIANLNYVKLHMAVYSVLKR
ncbi:MAG: hypothetical protein ACFFCW_31280 [Candidatus Hodarchaeota archaeon]